MPDRPDSPAAIPLYLQISEALVREIASGRLSDGVRLPPERKLAEQYRTTVRTLRKALAELENQGLLERVQGSGNYVRASAQVAGIYSMFRLELPQGSGLPTALVLDVTVAAKPDDLPPFGTSDRATRIRRLRSLDDMPVAVEEIWLDRDSGPVRAEDLSDSLYRYYQMTLGFWIIRAEDRVSIGAVPDWAPEGFSLRPGATAGFVERLSWAQVAQPVEFSRTWFDADRARYVQRLT